MKAFATTGVCTKENNYMVDITDRLVKMKAMVDAGNYFTMLREGFLARTSKGAPAFCSVILAGVTDIKSLKRKIRSDEAHKFNSPWNIAADFNMI